MTSPTPPERDLRSAITRGASGRCPSCGQAKLFARFLKPVARCPSCGQDWTLHSADDLPAYLVVLLLGHLIVPFIVEVNLHHDWPTWVQMLLWPGIAIVLAMATIQPIKGAVIGFQWARQMHGFAGGR